ncbi:MAG: hypothetical protein IMW94_02065 [Thermoanaerobacter sp.]|jgi:hypothetical protein|nr:hypothetical protein [Thermoanaerobacter sp.]
MYLKMVIEGQDDNLEITDDGQKLTFLVVPIDCDNPVGPEFSVPKEWFFRMIKRLSPDESIDANNENNRKE